MKLGGSMRRKRGKGARTSRGKSSPAARKRGGKRAPRSRGRLVMTLLALAAVGWGTGYLVATQFLYPAAPPPADVVEVPDVRGMGVAAAQERLLGSSLTLGDVDSLRHPSVTKDLILGQSPLPGQLAQPGTAIRVTRSLGAQMRAVPDVRRVDADRARIILESSGFVVSVDSLESEIPRGRVVSTAPSAGQTVALPAEIRLQVSTGPPLVPMPMLLGLEEAEALAVLDSLGLTVGEVEEVFRFGRDQGIVVEQEPPADTPMERGAAVRLAVGRRGG